MNSIHILATLALALAPAPYLGAQAIIAQNSGLVNPDHVIDFGANLFPNFTPVSTQFTGITLTHARYFTTGVSTNLVGGFITNDPIGPPDTLVIRFASPIRDLSFVYHQIGTSRPSVFRAMLGTTVVDSFSNSSNQFQTKNYFGFTNIYFDELQLDFVGDFNVDTLAFNDPGAACRTRNGSGINPVDFTCTTLPVLGTNWQSSIATNPNSVGAFLLIGLAGPHPGLPAFGGEILIQIAPPPVVLSSTGSFSLAIPSGPSWDGFSLPTQGLRLDIVGGVPTLIPLNALDLVFGL